MNDDAEAETVRDGAYPHITNIIKYYIAVITRSLQAFSSFIIILCSHQHCRHSNAVYYKQRATKVIKFIRKKKKFK